MAYEGMIAETIAIHGDKNETISAYVARPLGAGPWPVGQRGAQRRRRHGQGAAA